MLRGKKVNLTSVSEESLEQLRVWRNMPELRRYFREYRLISAEMQKAWFSRMSDDPAQINFEIRAIQTNENCHLIGHCGLYYINWINRTAEFGIYIGDNEFRGGGFGSDALRTLIRYGFQDLNLNRIWGEVYGNNKAIEIYRHIGFRDEGVLREAYFCDGRYWDSYMIAMIRSDYEQLES